MLLCIYYFNKHFRIYLIVDKTLLTMLIKHLSSGFFHLITFHVRNRTGCVTIVLLFFLSSIACLLDDSSSTFIISSNFIFNVLHTDTPTQDMCWVYFNNARLRFTVMKLPSLYYIASYWLWNWCMSNGKVSI